MRRPVGPDLATVGCVFLWLFVEVVDGALVGLAVHLVGLGDGDGREVGQGLEAPIDAVQLGVRLVVDERAVEVPDLDAVVDPQPWRGGGGQDEPAVWRPLAHTGVGRLEGHDLGELVLSVQDVDVAGQVPKTCHQDVLCVRGVQDGVSWCLGQRVDRVTSRVEEGGDSGHVAVDDGELSRRRRPRDLVDGALVREVDLLVKQTGDVQQIELGLAVVGLVGGVDVGGNEGQDGGAERVPLERAGLTFEELLLGDRALDVGQGVHLDVCRVALLARDEDGDGGVFPRRELEVFDLAKLLQVEGVQRLGEVEDGAGAGQLEEVQGVRVAVEAHDGLVGGELRDPAVLGFVEKRVQDLERSVWEVDVDDVDVLEVHGGRRVGASSRVLGELRPCRHVVAVRRDVCLEHVLYRDAHEHLARDGVDHLHARRQRVQERLAAGYELRTPGVRGGLWRLEVG